MSENPVVALLAKQSAKSLRDMDEMIGSQIDDLTTQRMWVRRALAEKGIIEPDPSSGRPTPSGTNRNGKRPGRRRGSKREAILQVMRTDPARVWLPSEVRSGLAANGIDVTVEAVRVTLRRMGDDNELVRPEGGNGWLLAPDVPSSGEPGTTDLSEEAPLFGEGTRSEAGARS